MLHATPLVCLRADADVTVACAVSGALSAWQSEWRSLQQRTIRVTEYVALAPAVFDAAPAPVMYHEAFPRVVGPLPPCEVVSEPVYDQVFRERFAAGETAENLVDILVVQEQVIVQAFPVVVGSLPPAEQVSAPVYHQVHHEQFAAGETTEKSGEFPVVQEQVIVQATPRVVDSLPPVAEFTVPVFTPVHQEQFSAGETTENIAKIPVVQDQVLVQAIPRFVGEFPPVEEFTAYVARRPSPLVEVRPSVRAQRHVVEQVADIAPMVQILDSPVPQTSEQLLEVLQAPGHADAAGAGYRSAQDLSGPYPAAFFRPHSADCGTVGGSADRLDSHAHRFADRGADRRHSSPLWSCSWFPPRSEFFLSSRR